MKLFKAYFQWVPSDFYCAQNAHLLLGFSTMEAVALHGWNPWIVSLTFLAITAFKEFYLDIRDEPDTMLGSCCDWTFYLLGILEGYLSVGHFWVAAVLTALPVAATTWIDARYPGNTKGRQRRKS